MCRVSTVEARGLPAVCRRYRWDYRLMDYLPCACEARASGRNTPLWVPFFRDAHSLMWPEATNWLQIGGTADARVAHTHKRELP